MLNKRGFTLVELTVTLGIAGLLTVVFMRFSLTTMNQEALLKYKASVTETLTLVQSSLKDPNKCTDMLKGHTISVAGTEVDGGLKINGGTISLLKQDTYADFEVTSIQLAESVFNATSFDIVISFQPRGITAFNSYFSSSNSDITKRITVVGLKNAGKVASCGPILSDTKLLVKDTFCKSMGRTGTMSGGNCVFKPDDIKCTPPYVPYRMKNDGTLLCTHIAQRIQYDQIFDFESNECTTKNYSFYQTPEGKITIGCPTPAQRAQGVDKPLN